MLLAETTHRDTRSGGIVADKIDGAADERSAGGVALGNWGGDASELGTDGITDINGQLRAADAFGLILNRWADAGHAFAPIGERPGRVRLINGRLGGQDDRGPAAGVEQAIGPERRPEEKEAEERQEAGHGVKLGGKWARGQGDTSGRAKVQIGLRPVQRCKTERQKAELKGKPDD